MDTNAIKLLNLYPSPINGALKSNFTASPAISENRNAFDTRLDINLSDKNQIFYRFSDVDDPHSSPEFSGAWPMAVVSRKVLRPHWRNRAHWLDPRLLADYGQCGARRIELPSHHARVSGSQRSEWLSRAVRYRRDRWRSRK